MTTQVKRILTVAILAILGLFVGIWLFKGLMTILPAIIGGVIGGLIAAVFIKGPAEVSDDVRRTVAAAVGKPKPRETDIEYVLTRALALNQLVRLEDGVSDPIRTGVERIIDIAEELAPPLCRDYPNDDLTYNTCRVVTYHLPRLLEPYFNIAPADRKAAEGGVVQALDAVEKDLADIQAIFRDQGIDAARHRAKTVEMKFTGFGGAPSAASA